MTKTKKIANKDENLPNIDVQDTVEAILSANKPEKKDEKLLRFHLYRMFGVPTQLSAKIAGYNDNYGYMLIKKYRNDTKHRHMVEKFVSRMPDDYRTICRLMLPDIAEAEMGAVRKYKEDPDILIRHPQLAKAIKQGAGVDLNEAPAQPKVTTINVKEIRMIHASLNPNEKVKPQIIDAEVVSDEESDK